MSPQNITSAASKGGYSDDDIGGYLGLAAPRISGQMPRGIPGEILESPTIT